MSIVLFALGAFVAPANASQICETVTTCEYTYPCEEECYYTRRGQLRCDIVCTEVCDSELVCYEDSPEPLDCYYLVDYDELYACLQG